MEQATNQFTKGLQLDTNPMVTGNDVMTDCLNGTIVTMSGNEVVLQNDMGNRRVNNAFLPSGYLPVGMKEFGGIIYVAAYNPITNKSLIGSFPSPLKIMDEDQTLKAEFDFNKFLSEENVIEDVNLGINVIKSDSFMIPLTGNTSLRAGDKFTVYANGLSDMQSNLTNYDNNYTDWTEIELESYDEITDSNLKKTEEVEGTTKYYKREKLDKVYSPKNKKYTLQLGVLNSQNEFVDITKTLCRWENVIVIDPETNLPVTDSQTGEYKTIWRPKTYDSEKSDIYKFNDGYFIPDEFNNEDFFENINDAEFIKHRLKIPVNTYAYKLVGPLYLKASLNHIEGFNYNIYGITSIDPDSNGQFTVDFYRYTNSSPIASGHIKITDETSENCEQLLKVNIIENLDFGTGFNNLNKFYIKKSDALDLNGTKFYTALNGLDCNSEYSLWYKIRNKNFKIWIEGYLTYNCPDDSDRTIINSNENYYTFEEGHPNFTGFDLIHNNSVLEPNSIIYGQSKYDADSNLYSTKIVKEYIVNSLEGLYDYTIGVLVDKDTPNIYIKELSVKGLLDLSLLGSGKVSINGWRFYNNVDKKITTLTYNFNAYPEYGKSFGNLRFKFENITNPSDVVWYPKPENGDPNLNSDGIPTYNGGLNLYNGRNTVTIDWGDNFKAQQVYKVFAYYDKIDENGTSSTNLVSDIKRWLLTTELFNEFYSTSRMIEDFCNTDDEEFISKMNLYVQNNSNITGTIEKSRYSPSYSGSLFTLEKPTEYNSNKPPYILYDSSVAYNFTILKDFKFNIKNKLLYPNNLSINYFTNNLKIYGKIGDDVISNEYTKNVYTWIKYSSIDSPTDYDMLNLPPDSKICYIGIAVGLSVKTKGNKASEYTWKKMWDSTPNTKVQIGSNKWVWIRYADEIIYNLDNEVVGGSGMGCYPYLDGKLKNYIGLAYNKQTNETPSDNFNDYIWTSQVEAGSKGIFEFNKTDGILDTSHIIDLTTFLWETNKLLLNGKNPTQEIFSLIKEKSLFSFYMKTLNNNISGTFYCDNYYMGDVPKNENDLPDDSKFIKHILNAFNSLKNVATSSDYSNYYTGIVLNWEDTGDGHFIEVVLNEPSHHIHNKGDNYPGWPSRSDYFKNEVRIYSLYGTGIQEVMFEDLSDKVYGAFNKAKFPGLMFIFLFPALSSDIGNMNGDHRNFYSKNIEKYNSIKDYSGESYARIWWRTKDGTWALFNNLMQYFDTNMLGSFLNSNLKLYVYCICNDYTVSDDDNNKYYVADNYCYYDKYQFPFTFILKYGINYITINNISEYDYGNLKFNSDKILNLKFTSEVTFNLESDSKFSKDIENFDYTKLHNIYLGTTLTEDIDKNALDPNSIYIYNFSNLSKDNTKFISVDRENLLEFEYNNLNTLVYNRHLRGVPEYQYDRIHPSDDESTALNYSGVNLISGVK